MSASRNDEPRLHNLLAVFHQLVVISCLNCTTMLKIPMSDVKGRFEHESTKKFDIG